MITTHDLRMVRGQTLKLRGTVVDEVGARQDLTAAVVHLRIRTDFKAAALISKSSPATGIAISAPQTGSTKGQFIATLAPADTLSLVVGDYVYDVWVVVGADKYPVVAPSRLTILPEVTTNP